MELIRVAGRLHDIGKIGIRESVLNKRGPLTAEEFEHVKTHVTIGAQILAPLTHLREVIGYVRSHHERADGTGYPDRLAGNEIPVGARIIGAAEVFDALTTARPYQEKMTPEEAVARMRDLIDTVIHDGSPSRVAAAVSRRRTAGLSRRASSGVRGHWVSGSRVDRAPHGDISTAPTTLCSSRTARPTTHDPPVSDDPPRSYQQLPTSALPPSPFALKCARMASS